jgi:hypothetical protein
VKLSDVERFVIPSGILAETEGRLRKSGARGLELFVLWSGRVRDSEFLVRTAHVPRQTSYQLESGLLVRVEGEALHQLNTWLYEHEETLAIQVHAHPADAFHSETDDMYPIVTERGSISIVAAYFCRGGLLSGEDAAYRLDDRGWHALDPPFALFQVI